MRNLLSSLISSWIWIIIMTSFSSKIIEEFRNQINDPEWKLILYISIYWFNHMAQTIFIFLILAIMRKEKNRIHLRTNFVMNTHLKKKSHNVNWNTKKNNDQTFEMLTITSVFVCVCMFLDELFHFFFFSFIHSIHFSI